MRVLCSLDPATLERELLRRVGGAQPSGAIGLTLIVVPTARLAEHVQRRLIADRDAWLGVEVLHFRALARQMLESTGGFAPRLISPRVLEALLRRILRQHDDNEWSRFVARRPGALRRLLGSLRDLREAGIEPDELDAARGRGRRDRDLAALYRRYCERLESVTTDGWVDDAGLVRAARRRAATFAAGRQAIFLHGAYELIGIHLALLRELDRVREITALLPLRPGTPVSAYAETFCSRHLLAQGAAAETLETAASDGTLGTAALYDEECRPRSLDGRRLAFRHTQGAAAEVRAAARFALQAVRDGCAPEEIVIAARGLAPYAASFEAVLDEQRLPWTTSLTTPLRRHPLVHDLMLLLDVLRNDFPRRATAEALRSPRIDWRALDGVERRPPGDKADRWSRQAAVVGGLDEWTAQLGAWAARVEWNEERDADDRAEAERLAAARADDAASIAAALAALNALVDPGRELRWSAHASRLERLVGRLFRVDDESSRQALDALRGLLDEMRDLEGVAGEERPVAFGEMAAWLEDAVDGSELAPQRRDEGGIRVLDAMQLRGMTCRRLFLLGLNAGQLPRLPREDPVLPDRLRERLRQQTGRPLSLKSEGSAEERLLLALVLGCAAERIDVSWQRADESGRAKTPSLALRELARLALGRPEMERLIASATHLPSHPEHWLDALERETGLLSPTEERLLTVLRTRGPATHLEGWYGELSAGLDMLRATEEFRMADATYDGRVGEPEQPAATTYGVSAMRQLGRCPLKFFFQHVLRVRELDQEVGMFEVGARDLGLLVHELLERLYRELQHEGLFGGTDVEALRRRGAELLAERWPQVTADLARRLSRRAPVLWERLEARWRTSLDAFVQEDLQRIADRGWGAPVTERSVEGEVEFAEGLGVRLRGRLDRSFQTADGAIVGDYKTGRIDGLNDLGEMLKGNELQVPLYWLLARPTARVEIYGIGPRHDPARVDSGERRLVFEGFSTDRQCAGLLETGGVLVSLIREGRFPLRPNEDCRWCAYVLACRRQHPPTIEREEAAADSRDFRRLKDKSARKRPLLDDLGDSR